MESIKSDRKWVLDRETFMKWFWLQNIRTGIYFESYKNIYNCSCKDMMIEALKKLKRYVIAHAMLIQKQHN